MVVFEVEPLSDSLELDSVAGIGSGVEVGIDAVVGIIVDVDDIDSTAIVASDVCVLAEEVDDVDDVDDVVVDVKLLVDDSCVLDVSLVGRIQNWRLQNPSSFRASASPKESTAFMAKGASQPGSQLMVQSKVVFAYPAA